MSLSEAELSESSMHCPAPLHGRFTSPSELDQGMEILTSPSELAKGMELLS